MFFFKLNRVIRCVCVQSLSHVLLFATPWTVACQASLTMEFPRQEYWSGLPFRSPGGLPNPGIEPTSPTPCALAGRFSTSEPPGKPRVIMWPNNSIPYRYLRRIENICPQRDLYINIHRSIIHNSQKQKNPNVSWLKNGFTKYGISKQWNVIHS